MGGLRLRMWVLGALLGGICLAPAASPAPSAAVVLEGGGAIHPGRAVTVTWDALPPGTEEFELLLRFEAPVAITLRLTESEDPGLTRFDWRVPAIPCDRARLVLRHGRGGRESTWAQSPPFAIPGTYSAPVPRVDFRSGEFWVSDEPAPAVWSDGRAGRMSHPSRGDDPARGSRRPPDSPTPRWESPHPASPPHWLPPTAPLPAPRPGNPLRVQLRI